MTNSYLTDLALVIFVTAFVTYGACWTYVRQSLEQRWSKTIKSLEGENEKFKNLYRQEVVINGFLEKNVNIGRQRIAELTSKTTYTKPLPVINRGTAIRLKDGREAVIARSTQEIDIKIFLKNESKETVICRSNISCILNTPYGHA